MARSGAGDHCVEPAEPKKEGGVSPAFFLSWVGTLADFDAGSA